MKTTTILIATIIAVLFSSCTEDPTPQQVTESFSNAYEAAEWDNAKKFATVKGIEQLESAEKSLLNMFDNLTVLGTNVNETVAREIEKVDCPENAENNCDCVVTFKNKETVTYKLVKENDLWKVDFELSKTEQIFNDVTDFIDEAVGDEIDQAVDQIIDEGIDMIADSVKSAMGM